MVARLLTAGLLLILGTGVVRAAPADPFAFVTQQVCVDAQDRPVPGDPAGCPARRRVRVGEAIPYRRVDAGNWQAFVAYPVQSPGGENRAMVAKIFGGNDTSGAYGDLGVRSGYDLLEIGATYVSGIRTSDQGAGDQIFWRAPDCSRPDGWIFFPPGLKPGEHGAVRSTLRITPGPSVACPWFLARSFGPDYTVWDRPLEPVRYTSGKRLDSIVSMHFAYGDPENPAHDNDSMEKFFFTEPYGYSRWEAWQTPEGCRKRAAKAGSDPAETCRPYPEARCSGSSTATYFGKLYLRLDCRDATFVTPEAERPFDPLVSDAAPGDVLSRNLLTNPTFFDGARGWSAGPDAHGAREPRTGNAVLDLPAGGRLSQDFAVPAEVAARAEGGALRWGATLGPAAAGTQARLTLTLEAAGGPVRAEQVVKLGPAARTVRFALPGPARPVSGRIELALSGPGRVAVDDVLVALVVGGPPAPGNPPE